MLSFVVLFRFLCKSPPYTVDFTENVLILDIIFCKYI